VRKKRGRPMTKN
nr:Chain B, Peptide from Spindlin interactor and repressor of chromatin-binding protein [Homo sapiens]7EA1_D Chain D, Peptide from Spindlin interactor and repressor of chromatin-binding protein [Homo sapiens]